MEYRFTPLTIASSLLLLGLSGQASAAEVADEAFRVLKSSCGPCHGAAMQMSNLDLRSRDSILRGGEHGPAVVPGDSEKSRLYRFVAGLENPAMPPGKPLDAAKVAILKRWIDAGAPAPAAANPEDEAKAQAAALAKMEDRPITAEERAWWAFRAPVRQDVPKVAPNPVDAFLRSALSAKGLKPSPKADKRTLIRRAYLVLTGLPPAPERVEAFVKDPAPDAFSKLVEELLASPHYGERWGRHWLDVVRYADSGGFEYDRDRPSAHRYRDYVIRAFNQDKPYDRFLKEQIAGDELWPNDKDARIATGFLRLGPENNIKNEQTRLDELDDIVVTTSNSMLGMTVGCARCHNHKFDPIPQKDYYRIQAVFAPTKGSDYPLVPQEDIDAYKAEMKRIDALQAPWKKQLKDLEEPYRTRIMQAKKDRLPDYVKVALQTPAEKRTEGQRLNALQVEKTLGVDAEELMAALSEPDKAQHKRLTDEIARIEAQRPPMYATAMTVVEPKGATPEPSYFLHRGSPGSKGSVMQPGVLTVAAKTDAGWQFPAPAPDSSTSQRRSGFAEWLASADNPLTARVMVNRIWQHHFGEGIVRTPSNFGKTGEKPTHPELLDWLTTEFIRTGWSVKAMHRLIVNSEAWQQASDDIAANVKIDPENRMLWRMPRRRLEAESIRDAVLAMAGNLDRTVGGPAVFPYIDPALFQSSSKRTWNGKPDTDPSTWRRSVYVHSKRSIPLPMLDIFDKPDTISSCARRNRSTIATQALIMMNNSFVLMETGKFAERLKRETGPDPQEQVDRAFLLALSRKPRPEERERALAFLKQDPEHGLQDFCQALINLNEFVYIP